MQKYILRMIGIILAIIAILAFICAVTATGSGFLDLSNITRVLFIAIAVICITLATFIRKHTGVKD